SDVSVAEGNSGTTSAVFTVSLAGATALPVTFNYGTANGTGIAGTDYQAANGTLTFNPGDTTKTITVLVVGNTIKQPARTFLVNLSSPTQATIGKGQGTGTIKDDDASPVLSITDVSVAEGNSGTTPAVFTVILTGATALPVTVNYWPTRRSSDLGTDYQAANGTLTFNPGDTTKTITVL